MRNEENGPCKRYREATGGHSFNWIDSALLSLILRSSCLHSITFHYAHSSSFIRHLPARSRPTSRSPSALISLHSLTLLSLHHACASSLFHPFSSFTPSLMSLLLHSSVVFSLCSLRPLRSCHSVTFNPLSLLSVTSFPFHHSLGYLQFTHYIPSFRFPSLVQLVALPLHSLTVHSLGQSMYIHSIQLPFHSVIHYVHLLVSLQL